MQSDISIVSIERLELRLVPWLWPFASGRRAEIDAHFDGLQRKQPKLWNGRVLMLHEYTVEGGALRGKCFETDFASMMAWRDWGFPDATVKSFFAMGALRTRDDAFVLGVMAPYTANPGLIYFASGTPEPGDVKDGLVDLEGSLWREIAEEMGLSKSELYADPRWILISAGPRLALIRALRAPQDAEELCAKIRAYLARDASPELSDIRIVRGSADFDPMMPPFITAFFRWIWA